MLKRWARRLLEQELRDAYWEGWKKGSSGRPLDPCGIPLDQHCPHSYIYDPGQ